MATTKSQENYDIYEVNFTSSTFDELYCLYAEKILPNVSTSEVGTALTAYVTRIIEPVGWQAIWKSPKQSFVKGKQQRLLDSEFLVEVHDVSMKKLQATVIILQVLEDKNVEEKDAEGNKMIDNDWLHSLMEIDVPLIQLYPLRDPEGIFLGTAKAIHTVRFFYENLWRPWDDDNDEGCFAEQLLRIRLEFYFELVSGSLPEAIECRCHDILAEASEIRSRIEQLQSQMALSDSEEELQEDDVRSCVQFHNQIESLQREMDILENPLLRNLMSKKDLPERQINRNETVIHIVSERVTVGMIKNLPVQENEVLQIHSTVETALSASISGDTILILSGHYKMGAIPWLEHNLIIKGLGSVTLEAGEGCGDLFFSCSAQSLNLCNLKLKPSPGMYATIMAHQGTLIIEHCIIIGAKNALVVLESSNVQMEECQISHSLGDAIQLRPGSSCTLVSCSIRECQGSAVKVDCHSQPNKGKTHLSIINCSMNKNGRFAVLAECPADLISPQEDVTSGTLKSLPFLDLTMDSVDTTGNTSGSLGLSPPESCKTTPVSLLSSPQGFSGLSYTCLARPLFPPLNDSGDEY